MSEPTSGVPEEIADAQVQEGADETKDAPSEVDLDLDEEKLEKWDEVKSDYQIDPDGKPMPNIWDAGEAGEGEAEHEAEQKNERNQAVEEDSESQDSES
jgi:hypothetical protein